MLTLIIILGSYIREYREDKLSVKTGAKKVISTDKEGNTKLINENYKQNENLFKPIKAKFSKTFLQIW